MAAPVFKTTKKSTQAPFTVDVAAGSWIFEEGQLGTEMFIVHEGRVELVRRVHEEVKQLAVFEKGDFFGEMALLEDLPRTASARALTDCQLVQINGSTFDGMLRGNPEIAVRMMRKLSGRLREADRLLRGALGSGSPGALEAVAAPAPPPPPLAGPHRLVHVASAMEFSIAESGETTVGRRDPVTGIQPGIDLSPFDGQRSVSRRHAKLFRHGTRVFVAEEIGTVNGTFVNGERIATGVPAELKSDDEVRFGLVAMRFRSE